MDVLLSRHRNLTVLVLALTAQLLLLAYQVKTHQDIRLIRVWAVSGFMPLARLVDYVRGNTLGAIEEYGELLKAREENQKLKTSVGSLKIENQFLRTQLSTADRAHALSIFQSQSPSKLVAARIVGSSTGSGAKVVFVDRGSNDGVQKGMAVITPDGIAGKVAASYPNGAQVILITDPGFAAGVISQKHRVQGTLKGQGNGSCAVEYIQNEEPLERGEIFYTSGVDRVFPKGLPVGRVDVVRNGKMFFKEVLLIPEGLRRGLEDVLIVLNGVHQPIPDEIDARQPLHLLAPPPEAKTGMEADRVIRGVLSTDADHLMEKYKRIGASTGHVYGAGGAPNFNVNPPPAPRPSSSSGSTGASENEKPEQ